VTMVIKRASLVECRPHPDAHSVLFHPPHDQFVSYYYNSEIYDWSVPRRAGSYRCRRLGNERLYKHPSARSKRCGSARSKNCCRQSTAVHRRTVAANYWQQTPSTDRRGYRAAAAAARCMRRSGDLFDL